MNGDYYVGRLERHINQVQPMDLGSNFMSQLQKKEEESENLRRKCHRGLLWVIVV